MAIKIEKISKKEGKMVFLVKGIDHSIANAIRRSVLEIPVLAIDIVEFVKNDSALYDEIIAHRLGLVPLHAPKNFTPRERCSCKGKGCAKCTAGLKLKAKGPGMVYTKEIKARGINVVHEEMPLVLLNEGQELEFSATATLGKGINHAKYTPGLLWFNAFPVINAKNCEGCDECIDICPTKAISLKNKKLEVDPIKCDICEACVEYSRKRGKCNIEIKPSEEDFIFFIESFGQLKSEEIFKEAISALETNLKELSKKIKK